MAVRNAKPLSVTNWLGMDQFTDPQETQPNVFVDSLNVVVSPTGNVLPLRSPANYNLNQPTGNKVLSGVDYTRTAGNVIIYDLNSTAAPGRPMRHGNR